MKIKQPLLVAVLFNQDTDISKVAYSINSVFAQTYDDINLLILGNRTSNFNFEALSEMIASNRRSNIKEVNLYFPKYNKSCGEFYHYIYQYSISKNAEYISLLTNGNAFYQSDSLELIAKYLISDDEVVLGNTVLYNERDEYCGELSYDGNSPQENLEELLRNYFKAENGDNWKVGGLIKTEIFDMILRTNVIKKVRYAAAIYFLRFVPNVIVSNRQHIENAEKLNLLRNLNYTESIFIKTLLTKLIKKGLTAEEITQLQSIETTLINNVSPVWGKKINADWLSVFMDECIKIKSEKWRYLKLLKYRKLANAEKNLKVVFFVHQYNTWPSLKSIYEAFKKDEKIETRLVYVEGAHANANKEKMKNGRRDFEQAGLNIISFEQYDLKRDNPDIAFFVVPYSFVPTGFAIDDVSKVVSRCIYVPYGFTLESDLKELVRLRYQIAAMYLAWKVVCDDDFNVDMGKRYAYSMGRNFVNWGNPRVDMIKGLPLKEDEEYIKEIRMRARGRKLILWNVHHSISDELDGFSTWTYFGEKILNYVESNQNKYYFVWRPHPLFWNALKSYMGEKKYQALMKREEKVDNLFIDTYRNYLAGFSVADIFLTDASSLAKEFVFTGKPVICTVMNEDVIINRNLRECFYLVRNMEECEQVIMQIICGKDSKKSIRKQYIGDDSEVRISIGENIKEKIFECMDEELQQLRL